ncbi:MAG: hypothetical protein KatS3mg060_3264 [Dehalococcoidia bacterium]|nr:MAG: hypothetical protein KatS3mg060_3264 [Dehalococcoidia bacterium]
MTVRDGRRLLSIFLVALLVRFCWLSQSDGPGYLDASYQLLVAQRLAVGDGLTTPVIWHWLRLPEAVIHPSHDYWMPLGALLAAVGLRLFGDGWLPAVLPGLILSALLAPIAAALTRRWGGGPFEEWVAAGLALFAGGYSAHWATTDPMTMFAPLGALALIAADGAGQRSALAAGALAGLGQLARADGFLLLATVLVVRLRREPAAAALAAIVFVAIIAPWLVRGALTFGSSVPVGLTTVWLTEYNDLFRPVGATPAEWWNRGLSAIAQEKVLALTLNFAVLALLGHLFLTPFALAGLLAMRRPAPLVYLGLLLFFASLVFTYPGARGAFAHGLTALIPASAAGALLGLRRFADWLAIRRGLRVTEARQRIALIALAGTVVAGSGLGWQQLAEWRTWRGALADAVAFVESHAPAAIVVAADPATYAVLSGRPAVVMPNLPPAEAIALARRYGARIMVIGDAYPRPWSGWLGGESIAGVTVLGEVAGFRIIAID